MTTAYSTQGRVVRYGVQSDLVTKSTYTASVKPEEAGTFPTDEFLAEPQSNLGHENAFDRSDEPILYKGVRENAITIPIAVRTSNAAAVVPTLATFAESGGCNVDVSDNDTIATYTSTTDFTLTTGLGANKNGQAILVELDDGTYWPTLLADYVHSTTTCTPGMALPSASSVSNATYRMYTITPQTGQVTASKLLSLAVETRGLYTSAPDLGWNYTGCALGAWGEITIEPGGQVMLSPTFHCADVDVLADALATEAATDTTYKQRNYGNFRFELGAANASGAISSTHMELLKATINLGSITTAIPGEGSTDVLNSIQGYMATMPEAPTITLELLMDKAYWEAFDNSPAQTNQYLSFLWPTTDLNVPASGLWFPNCYQSASPVAEIHGSDYIKCTLVYTATAPTYGSATANNATGMAPWYMAVHSTSA